ncbi:MAG: GDSL-type esterase/lipase family protein [Bacilli bacterium]|nr:GDSL-type esterase/lipase family protein [Bacilli bacterium]
MKILCYGDSNTWGHIPESGNRFNEMQRWPKLLQHMLKDSCEVIEDGLCGRCASFVDSVKPYRHGISTLRTSLEVNQPIDLVILMLGTNDLKASFSANAVAVSNGIKEMVQIIKNKYIFNKHMSSPQVLIISPIYIREGFQNVNRIKEQFDQNSFDVAHQLASFYKEIAEMYDCEFMDAAQYAQASPIDCIHMDAENHKKLAEAIYQKIAKC